MIPYFVSETVSFWPVPLRTWGVLVAAGVLIALWYGRREARQRDLSVDGFTDLVAAVTFWGLVGARLGFFLFYDASPLLTSPWAVFRLWEGGLSLIGTVVAVTLYFAARHRSWRQLLPFAEVAALSYPLGEAIGRLGCFLIHDHPGLRSDAWFAVAYPGGARLDLGLVLSAAAAVTFIAFAMLNRRPRQAPFFLPLLAIVWGLVRLTTDFLRAADLTGADARYAGLTPAQYGGLALAIGGLLVFVARRRARAH